MNNFFEVKLSNIYNNLDELKKIKKDICIPIKANAYGFGYSLMKYFINYGYNFFGVSTMEEAIWVRKNYSDVSILLFGSVFKDDLIAAKKYDIIISIYDFEILTSIENDIKFHLKFDTGMGRLGFAYSEKEKVKKIILYKKLKPEGIYTHLSQASNDKKSILQINTFEKIVNFLKSDIDIKYVHYANGLAAMKYDTKFDNLIRPGLVVYGYFENSSLKKLYGKNIKSSAVLKTKCGHIKHYDGEIGYDGIENIKGNIITIPLGYHDGLKQSYRGYTINDVGSIVGKICMCQSMIKLDDNLNKEIKKGDEIVLFSYDDIYGLSEYSKVSIYEILAILGNRIERVYVK